MTGSVSTPIEPRRKRLVTEYAKIMVAHRGLTIYRVATPGWRWGWNRYSSRRWPIGIGFVTGRICWSITWARA